jgi:hypothetical protein
VAVPKVGLVVGVYLAAMRAFDFQPIVREKRLPFLQKVHKFVGVHFGVAE